MSTVDDFQLHEYENYSVLTLRTIVEDVREIAPGVDAYFMAILMLCRWVTDGHTAPRFLGQTLPESAYVHRL